MQGLAAASWNLSLYVVFNHWNVRDDYYLYGQWMRLTQEIPAESNPNYKLVGLSKEENDKFWQTERWFNQIFYRSVNVFLSFIAIFISGLLFMVRFESVALWLYLLVQTVNALHLACFFFLFFNSIYTVNALYIAVIRILTKKFDRIASRTARLNAPRGAKPINNRRLSRLIFDHNRVHLELLEMNAFFSSFVAVNLVHLFG